MNLLRVWIFFITVSYVRKSSFFALLNFKEFYTYIYNSSNCNVTRNVVWWIPDSHQFFHVNYFQYLEVFQYCEWFLPKCDEREDIQDSVLWSDEDTLKINEKINRYSCMCWASETPKIVEENLSIFQEEQHGVVCLWGLIGIYFFGGIFTGQTYLQMLKTLIPHLLSMMPSDTAKKPFS